jgi:hypothetical protein
MRDVPADATTTPPPRSRRFLGAAAEALLITALIFGVIAGTTLAAKGGNGGKPGGSSSLSLVMVDPADTQANHGDVVTFDVSTTATDKPYVNLRCYQVGTIVYDYWAGFYDGAWFGQDFTLASAYWQSGGADCVARLAYWARNGRERTVAQMDFFVAP